MENINASYSCYKNAKKLGEYTKNPQDIRFKSENGITLEDAIDMSVTLAKHFEMAVHLSFGNQDINIPYQKSNMPNVQDIINKIQNTNNR